MGKQVISTAGEKVKVTLTSLFPRVPSGRQGGYLPMLVRVEAPPTAKQHVPVDVVALLNVSGSMNMGAAPGANTPSRMDLLKKAMNFVIRHLHEDDGLAIVPFNEKVVTSHSTDIFRISGQRVVAQNKVDKLMAKGDTSFSPALEQAVKILDERTEKNRLGVIMLLTDGLDNRKIALYPIPPELLKKYPVHTFGICTHEPTVLLLIAQQSGGTYSFIDDKDLGKITDAFAVFIGGLSSIVAINVLITLESNPSLSSISCGFESSEITQPSWISSSNYITGYIRIGSLYAGEVKNFIAYFDNFQVEPEASGTREYPRIPMTYNETPGGPSIDGDGNGAYLRTGKQAGDPEENFRMVREQIVQFNVVDFLSTLHAEFRKQTKIAGGKGDKEAMDAQIRAGSTLETKWAKFMDIMDDDLKDGLLDDLQIEVTEMASRLKRGAGMAYMCSWLSTQQMQRATTLGSVDMVGTQFFTPIMDDMIRESQKYHVLLPQGSSAPGGSSTTTTKAPNKPPLGLVAQKKLDWSNLKLQAQAILGQPQDNDLIRLRDEMMVAIDKAMKQDIYLAAVGP